MWACLVGEHARTRDQQCIHTRMLSKKGTEGDRTPLNCFSSMSTCGRLAPLPTVTGLSISEVITSARLRIVSITLTSISPISPESTNCINSLIKSNFFPLWLGRLRLGIALLNCSPQSLLPRKASLLCCPPCSRMPSSETRPQSSQYVMFTGLLDYNRHAHKAVS